MAPNWGKVVFSCKRPLVLLTKSVSITSSTQMKHKRTRYLTNHNLGPIRGTPSLAETVKLFLMILILNPGRK
jgi:hypothetical protein